jgi:hypothetical protein
MNFVLGTIGSYKDARRAGDEGDELLAKLHLAGTAMLRGASQIKDTWIAKGIGDLTDLVGNVAKAGSIRGRQIVKDKNDVDYQKVHQAISQGEKTIINNYVSMPLKAINPLKSSMVQQIWRGITPEGRQTATMMQIMKYNLGIQNGIPFTQIKEKYGDITKPIGSNDLRTDIFGNVIKTLPGDQGMAWPRANDPHWSKIWQYNINLDDITPKDRKEVKGRNGTLEYDQYLHRKTEANELFKNRFDDYFSKLTPEEIKEKSGTLNTSPRGGAITNQLNDELNDIWQDTKDDVDKKLFVWDKEAKEEPKLFDELINDGVLPQFWNQKVKIGGKQYIVPFDILEKYNEEAMKSFIPDVKEYLESGDIDADKTPLAKTIQENISPEDEENMPILKPDDSIYKRTIAGLWKKATAELKLKATEEIKKNLPKKK